MSKRTAPTPPAANPASDVDTLVDRFLHHLRFTQGESWETAQPYDHFVSLALAVRDQIVGRMIATQSTYHERDVKRVYYLSLEYLLGRQLRNNLVCLGLYDACRHRLERLGLDLDHICGLEPDAGLGNGGLGRLAACYLDSATTLALPFYGYGLRYEYGIFQQEIVQGWQVERPDYWLRFGSPWEIPRPEFACPVRLYGHVEGQQDARGRYRPTWRGYRMVIGLPYDIPAVAYGSNTVNILRLWSARASENFDLAAFNRGGYVEAVREQALSETITKVLYPSDETDAGRELRLAQQYFFVACTLSDVIRRYEKTHDTFDDFPDKVAIQLNDTHPALAIAELMAILVDERGLPWERAWELTRATFAYTNHTLLPEALEKWPVPLMARVLPRHLQIIFEINQRFLDGEVRQRWPDDTGRRQNLSLVQEGGVQAIQMAHLAIVGSHNVNGVAALHTDLLRTRVVPDFAALWPEKFLNVTNGVTPRRWLLACNPGLAAAITQRIGSGWVADLDQLRRLERYADDADFQAELRAVKRANKQRLAGALQKRMGVALSPDALFDVQVKRLHEYKRQLLNLLHVIIRYHALLDGAELTPRVVIFGAKAAPAYSRAKLIIKLINDVAKTVNHDKRIGDRLRVVFVPNYGVSLAEQIIPAADLSEQISTAGTEASGTGNMKFALNGALTIGTLDGANIEIRDAVGPEHFFLFGLTADEVAARRPFHNPWQTYYDHAGVHKALNALADGQFSGQTPTLFRPVLEWLTHERDYYMLMADIESYLQAQQQVDALWSTPAAWDRATILNIARVGYFSSDRAVRDYAEKIWHVTPTPITLPQSTLGRTEPPSRRRQPAGAKKTGSRAPATAGTRTRAKR
ncbi:MAG: glycogen/starch/alpha-glucan phosphorylase [Phycisphaerae bacterium]|nr:glycogen/starch/alpha-glucan phosphorylase [Phycisphaerae bacterium]